ncbi:MAG: hypothetical protein AAGC60_19100 [Acidobacteriota bacterium]
MPVRDPSTRAQLSSRERSLRRRHLLRVEQSVVKFAPLIAAVRQAGGRLGWLDWHPQDPPSATQTHAPHPAFRELEQAADAGVLRAVDAAARRIAVVKPLAGPPVLHDVLREHFRGCAGVLVRGAIDAPRLEPAADGQWSIRTEDRILTLDTAALVARLRRPAPFDGSL